MPIALNALAFNRRISMPGAVSVKEPHVECVMV
jgi:hypothetical protein